MDDAVGLLSHEARFAGIAATCLTNKATVAFQEDDGDTAVHAAGARSSGCWVSSNGAGPTSPVFRR